MLKDLSEENLLLLRWRSNIWDEINISTSTICEKHHQKFFYWYEVKSVNCIDPFHKHCLKVTSGIRSVDLDFAMKNKDQLQIRSVPPGCKLCVNCRKEIITNIDMVSTFT